MTSSSGWGATTKTRCFSIVRSLIGIRCVMRWMLRRKRVAVRSRMPSRSRGRCNCNLSHQACAMVKVVVLPGTILPRTVPPAWATGPVGHIPAVTSRLILGQSSVIAGLRFAPSPAAVDHQSATSRDDAGGRRCARAGHSARRRRSAPEPTRTAFSSCIEQPLRDRSHSDPITTLLRFDASNPTHGVITLAQRLFHYQMAGGPATFSRGTFAITSATNLFVKNGFLDIETLPNRLFKARSAGAKGEPFK